MRRRHGGRRARVRGQTKIATSWWEPVASLLISLIAAGFVILVSERIYRRALMQTGGKLSMRQALKLTD